MYENEVVRVSDQVLATYLFYLSVFRDRVLDFAILLEHFFPRLRHRFIDALNSVFGAFDSKALIERLRPAIDRAWSVIQQRGNDEELINLIDVFFFMKQTETLLYVRDKIRLLQPEPRSLSELSFVSSSQAIPSPSILSILDNFRYVEDAVRRSALSLLLDYLEKRPVNLPFIIRMLSERYGITRHSQLEGFRVERQVIDVLWDKAQHGANELFSRLFLVISEFFLHTHFSTHESKNDAVVTIYQFDIPDTEELLQLRQVIWQRVFALYAIPSLQKPILHLLHKHIQSGLRSANLNVISKDAIEVQTYFRSSLSPSVYAHCVIVQNYLAMLKRVGGEVNEELKTYFTNDTFALSELILDDRNERRELGWEEYQRTKRERLAAHTAKFTVVDFSLFFNHCFEILGESERKHDHYQIQNSVASILLNLAERDATLFETVLDNYLHVGNALELGPWALAAKLIETSGTERAYEILAAGEYPGQTLWLFSYFMALPSEAVCRKRLDQLYTLYEKATWQDLQGDMDYLLKFADIDQEIVIRATRILTDKASVDINVGYALSHGIFAENSNIATNLEEIFAHDIELLKQAYFAAYNTDQYTDYQRQTFNTLLNLAPDFAREWVLWKYKNNEWISRHDDSTDYSFMWRRDDYKDVITRIIGAVRDKENTAFHLYSYLEVFFMTREEDADAPSIRDKQDALLDEIIERHHTDQILMKLLFGVISNFSPERRRARILTFIRNNQDFESFSKISLESSFMEWTDSAVPMLQGRVDFFESLLPMLNSLELLQHRQRIEQRIQGLREHIEYEK